MNSAWRKLATDCVIEREFEVFESDVSSGTDADLTSDSQEDVEELIDEYRYELTKEATLTNEMSSDEDDKRKDASTTSIKEIGAKWNDIQNFVYRPLEPLTQGDSALLSPVAIKSADELRRRQNLNHNLGGLDCDNCRAVDQRHIGAFLFSWNL
ncbi:hypothetical protein RF11_15645 [Thelohanellus kitauei]|uniref:Uncharacterized protein n=1 Tax=Thelohanellus kitauei TaxID=669202 RepID=A0A0C2IZ66_THEKT|nr:hypothetical protein RF11_15645 [Thelohanellus kitauei]